MLDASLNEIPLNQERLVLSADQVPLRYETAREDTYVNIPLDQENSRSCPKGIPFKRIQARLPPVNTNT